MYCTNCGKKADSHGKFCWNCGKNLSDGENLSDGKNLSSDIKIPKQLKLPEIYELSLLKKFAQSHRAALFNGAFLTLGIIAAFTCISKIILPFYGGEMLSKALTHIENQNYEEAVEAFAGAEAAGVAGDEIGVYKAQAYFNLGNYESAKEILSETYEDLAALKLLAEIHKTQGDSYEYERTLQKIIEIAPNDETAYLELAQSYREKSMYDSAANTLEKLLSRRKSPAAGALLYNIHVESYTKTSSMEKAAAVKDDAFSYLTNREITSLDTAEGETVNVSPSGNFILSKTGEFVDVYSFDGENFKFMSGFKIPANYDVDFGMIAWNQNEDKLAFHNSSAEEFIHDSSIYLYDLKKEELKNLTDPGEDYIYYMDGADVYILDTIPCFSESGEYIYFARRTIKGNFLSEVNIESGEITNLYEPSNGGRIDYAIACYEDKIYFSLTGENRDDLWGLYVYENETARKLKFQYDDRYYDLALKSLSSDGRYLLYYVTVACQNNSFYFKILDLENMKLKEIYPQEINSVDSKMYALNHSNILGMSVTFITRNAEFSSDGKSLIVAEDSLGYWGKTIRKVNINTGGMDLLYTSCENDDGSFGLAEKNIGGLGIAEVSGGVIVADKGFKLVR